MALSFGPGVSRTLDPVARAFQNVVFQKGKPPLDSELNFQDSIHDEQMRQQIAAMMPSGFVFDPTRPNEYYGFNKQNSNQFSFGQVNPLQNDQPSILAVVNGWVVQVAGTDIAASVDNLISFDLARNQDRGFALEEGWWRKPITDFADQIKRFCPGCGVPAKQPPMKDFADTDTYTDTNADIAIKSQMQKKRKVIYMAAENKKDTNRRVTSYNSN